jgi:hypothetical protein
MEVELEVRAEILLGFKQKIQEVLNPWVVIFFTN